MTRPAKQSVNLTKELQQAGFDVINFPVIETVATDPSKWPHIDLEKLDMLVFVSRNAVDDFFAGIQCELPANLKLVSVGGATSNSIRSHGYQVAIEAPPPAGSESLLQLPEMQNIVDKQFLIVRGTGGRELLANTLMTRGAKISYLEVYQRQIPSLADVEIDQAKQADAIIVTSNTGLDNLCQLVAVDSIKDKSLIVVSDRIRQHAVELGFQHIYVTDDVSDAAMVQQVIEVGQNNGK